MSITAARASAASVRPCPRHAMVFSLASPLDGPAAPLIVTRTCKPHKPQFDWAVKIVLVHLIEPSAYPPMVATKIGAVRSAPEESLPSLSIGATARTLSTLLPWEHDAELFSDASNLARADSEACVLIAQASNVGELADDAAPPVVVLEASYPQASESTWMANGAQAAVDSTIAIPRADDTPSAPSTLTSGYEPDLISLELSDSSEGAEISESRDEDDDSQSALLCRAQDSKAGSHVDAEAVVASTAPDLDASPPATGSTIICDPVSNASPDPSVRFGPLKNRHVLSIARHIKRLKSARA